MAEKQWCTFKPAGTSESGKTCVWAVKGSGGPRDHIGEIRWNGAWRCYVFEPGRAIFNAACLDQIAEFCRNETAKHFAAKVLAREAARGEREAADV